jgi:amidase
MTDLHYLSLIEISRRLRRREISSQELTRALLERIGAENGRLHVYIHVMGEAALQAAKEADAEIAAGRVRGPLHGVPIGLKDLCATPGAPTLAGGIATKGWNPDGEATVARRLREAGSVLLGKLQTTEGAYAAHHPDVAAPVNPWNPDYWTGVSSSGSGAGTAAGLCFASLGTDTGGSIRFPSHSCGLVGLKPTWGRVSRFAVFPLAESLDHIGPITRTVEDAAAVLGVIAGPDENDPTALPAPVPNYLAELEGGVRGLRVGYDPRHCSEGVAPETAAAIRASVEILRDRGAEICSVEAPNAEEATAHWGLLCGVEAAIAHEATYPAEAARYGPVLSELLDVGRAASGIDYARGHDARLRLAGAYAELFQQVDMMIEPSNYTTTPTNQQLAEMIQSGEVGRLIAFTAAADLVGAPAICVPGGFDAAGVPFGFQIVGDRLSEDRLLRAGYALQEDSDWKHRHPHP